MFEHELELAREEVASGVPYVPPQFEEPCLIGGDRFGDIGVYVSQLFLMNPHSWGAVMPWDFPQNASRDLEQTFMRKVFGDYELHLQGGMDGEGAGYRFCKQAFYCAALWNCDQRLPAVADWWLNLDFVPELIEEPACLKAMLSEEATPTTFFEYPELEMYGLPFLQHVVKMIQIKIKLQLEREQGNNPFPAPSIDPRQNRDASESVVAKDDDTATVTGAAQGGQAGQSTGNKSAFNMQPKYTLPEAGTYTYMSSSPYQGPTYGVPEPRTTDGGPPPAPHGLTAARRGPPQSGYVGEEESWRHVPPVKYSGHNFQPTAHVLPLGMRPPEHGIMMYPNNLPPAGFAPQPSHPFHYSGFRSQADCTQPSYGQGYNDNNARRGGFSQRGNRGGRRGSRGDRNQNTARGDWRNTTGSHGSESANYHHHLRPPGDPGHPPDRLQQQFATSGTAYAGNARNLTQPVETPYAMPNQRSTSTPMSTQTVKAPVSKALGPNDVTKDYIGANRTDVTTLMLFYTKEWNADDVANFFEQGIGETPKTVYVAQKFYEKDVSWLLFVDMLSANAARRALKLNMTVWRGSLVGVQVPKTYWIPGLTLFEPASSTPTYPGQAGTPYVPPTHDVHLEHTGTNWTVQSTTYTNPQTRVRAGSSISQDARVHGMPAIEVPVPSTEAATKKKKSKSKKKKSKGKEPALEQSSPLDTGDTSYTASTTQDSDEGTTEVDDKEDMVVYTHNLKTAEVVDKTNQPNSEEAFQKVALPVSKEESEHKVVAAAPKENNDAPETIATEGSVITNDKPPAVVAKTEAQPASTADVVITTVSTSKTPITSSASKHDARSSATLTPAEIQHVKSEKKTPAALVKQDQATSSMKVKETNKQESKQMAVTVDKQKVKPAKTSPEIVPKPSTKTTSVVDTIATRRPANVPADTITSAPMIAKDSAIGIDVAAAAQNSDLKLKRDASAKLDLDKASVPDQTKKVLPATSSHTEKETVTNKTVNVDRAASSAFPAADAVTQSDVAQLKEAEKAKGPSQTESLSMFGKKNTKKSKKDKAKGSIKKKPEELKSTQADSSKEMEPETAMTADVDQAQAETKHVEPNVPKTPVSKKKSGKSKQKADKAPTVATATTKPGASASEVVATESKATGGVIGSVIDMFRGRSASTNIQSEDVHPFKSPEKHEATPSGSTREGVSSDQHYVDDNVEDQILDRLRGTFPEALQSEGQSPVILTPSTDESAHLPTDKDNEANIIAPHGATSQGTTNFLVLQEHAEHDAHATQRQERRSNSLSATGSIEPNQVTKEIDVDDRAPPAGVDGEEVQSDGSRTMSARSPVTSPSPAVTDTRPHPRLPSRDNHLVRTPPPRNAHRRRPRNTAASGSREPARNNIRIIETTTGDNTSEGQEAAVTTQQHENLDRVASVLLLGSSSEEDSDSTEDNGGRSYVYLYDQATNQRSIQPLDAITGVDNKALRDNSSDVTGPLGQDHD